MAPGRAPKDRALSDPGTALAQPLHWHCNVLNWYRAASVLEPCCYCPRWHWLCIGTHIRVLPRRCTGAQIDDTTRVLHQYCTDTTIVLNGSCARISTVLVPSFAIPWTDKLWTTGASRKTRSGVIVLANLGPRKKCRTRSKKGPKHRQTMLRESPRLLAGLFGPLWIHLGPFGLCFYKRPSRRFSTQGHYSNNAPRRVKPSPKRAKE